MDGKKVYEENIYKNIKTSNLIASIDRHIQNISKEQFFHKYPHSVELIEYINKRIKVFSNNVKIHYCSRSVSYSSNRVFMNVIVNKTYFRITFLGIDNKIKTRIIDISDDSTQMNGLLNVYNKQDFDYLYDTIKYSYELSLSKI